MSGKVLFAAVVVVLAGMVVAAAYAFRAPTETERRGIVAAILDKQLRNNCHGFSACHPHISRIRVSLANTHYASATLSVPGYHDAYALLRKLYGSWRVTDIGTDHYVGCGKAPKAVRVDLELTCFGGK